MKIKVWIWAIRSLSAGFVFGTIICVSDATPFTFSNTNFIAINDSTNPLTKAALYPSAMVVTGLDGLVVTKATVTLQGLSHTFPSDVGILLVGPHGQMTILMSEVGGQQQYSVTNLTLILDDDATNSLPLYDALNSGMFKPTNGYLLLGHPNLPYDFPSPAPPGNSNSVSALSVVKNTDPNGTWNLFVICDAAGTDSGSLSSGWTLNLSVAVPLKIVQSLTNVVISWPASVTNCQLQSSSSLLGSALWNSVPTMPVSNGSMVSVTNPILQGSVFYRLVPK